MSPLVGAGRGRSRGVRGRRVVPAVLFAAMLALALGACGQPLPAPAGAAPAERQPPGRLLYARGGDIWAWQDGQETQLTSGGGRSQPRWSPDGAQLLWVQGGDSYADLWVADAGGRSPSQVTANRSTRFPPDSKDYVDSSFRLTGPSWARAVDGGDRLVYSADYGGGGFALWVVNGLRGRPQPVFGTQDLPGHIEGAALSPDGGRIAFTYDTGDADAGKRTTQIYIVDLATGQRRALTSEPAGSYDPAWSPDGRWIAFVSRAEGGTNIWIIRPDGSDRRRLSAGGADRGTAWSPDGDRLAFLRLHGSGYSLFYVDLTAAGGGFTAGKAQQIVDHTDLDPASGVSWAR